MKKNTKILSISIILTLFFSSLSAQSSNTYLGTAKTIRTDADNFMDVNYFQNTKFQNLIAFTRFSGTGLELGFGKKFNNFYLGTSYSGNLWGGTNNISQTQTNTSSQNILFSSTNNSFNILFGFSNMGIKAGAKIITDIDNNDRKQSDKSSYDFKLLWGGIFPGKKIDFYPIASIDVGFGKYKQLSNFDSQKINQEKFLISGTLGSDLLLGKSTPVKSVIGFNYGFNFSNYKEVPTNKVSSPNEQYYTNSLDLHYSLNYKINEKFKIGGIVDITNSVRYCELKNSKTSELLISAIDYKLKAFINFGVQFSPIPTLISINSGFSANLPAFSYQYINQPSPNITQTSKETGKLLVIFYNGIEFKLGKDFLLDMKFEIPVSSEINKTLIKSLSLGLSYKI